MPYCSNCGRDNKEGYSYCGECGTELNEPSTQSTTESSANGEESKKRRSITIGRLILYTVGILIIMGALGAISSTPVGGIIILLTGIFLLPVTRRWIKFHFDVAFSTWIVIVIVIVGFLVGAGAIGSGISDSSNGGTGTKFSTNDSLQTRQPSTSITDNGINDNQKTSQSMGGRSDRPERKTGDSEGSLEQIDKNIDAISINNATVVVEYSGGWDGYYASNIKQINNYDEHQYLTKLVG